jgi:hypothetical protein
MRKSLILVAKVRIALTSIELCVMAGEYIIDEDRMAA